MKAKFKVTNLRAHTNVRIVDKKPVRGESTLVTLAPIEGDISSPVNLNLSENTFEFGQEYEVELTFKKVK
jgi:hypothetical protein